MLAAKQKIVVGLSGGVDSAVTAWLLKEQGHEVTGVFMQNWANESEDSYCTAEQDLTDARTVADQIGIPLYTVNFADDYWSRVFQHCLDEFALGRTPNPDIWCNREIKFSVFLEHTKKLNADKLATGHYARITGHPVHKLEKATDPNKDQSYFLHTLGQRQLEHSLFPLGNLLKTEVRKIAQKNRFINASKKDSTGICFIGERRFKSFLSEFLLAQPGEIQTPEGKTIGRHDGVMFYTIGQRQGLNIGGVAGFDEKPWYVLAKDLKHNILIAGQGHDHPMLYRQKLDADKLHWVAGISPKLPLNCSAKTRYRQQDQLCTITSANHDCVTVEFETPQRAITPGQSVVFYQEDSCLGGGTIK